jgi:site-specific DNA-methyltransferase (adenine-specific)/adenine-specific DNA-methyltransferase
MPTLHWIGKEAVVNHHHTVPFHLLRDVPELSVGDPGSGNLIVQGDNLVALKALLPYYAGQVKCIYIDPPYNTGNEGWVYNDNVNSPLIRAWLGQAVGKEAEDLSRHDKWLCMMYPRLAVLRQFLREDGVIFISIDEDEVSNLLQLLDDLFGRSCRLALFTWIRKKKGSNLSKEFRKVTEFVAAYKRTEQRIPLHGVPAYAEKMVPLLNRTNPETKLVFPAGKLKVGRGVRDGIIQAGTKGADKGELAVILENALEIRDGIIISPFTLVGRWRWSQQTVDFELRSGSEFVVSKDFRINVSRFNQAEKFKAPESLLAPDDGVGTNEDATEELRDLFSDCERLPFDFPKPRSLVEFLVRAVCKDDPSAIVLDSFAGSGTTGHAVLQLNAQSAPVGTRSTASPSSSEKSGTEWNRSLPTDRRFILVEIEPKIARDITAERVKRVAQGYINAKGEPVAGLGGGFRFCELGEPLFDAAGHIRPSVTFAELARHVYFTETGEPLPRERVSKSPLLGVCRGVAVYLLFNGILGDKTARGGNVLTRAVLAQLPRHAGPKVIYGAGCLLGPERLHSEQITFRQTPYEIRVS